MATNENTATQTMTQPNAGILLIELNCDNGAGRCEHAFILFQSGGKSNYSNGVRRGGKSANNATNTNNANNHNGPKDNVFNRNGPKGGNAPTSSQPRRVPRENTANTWSDGGGKRESFDDSPAHTATREMREESSGLVAIPPEYLANTLMIDIGHKYMCFVIATDTYIDAGLYKENRRILALNNAPGGWRETIAIGKFYLTDLLKRTRADMATDIHGVEHILSSRVQHILTGVILMRDDPVKRINAISLDCTIATSPDFAVGTSVYIAGNGV